MPAWHEKAKRLRFKGQSLSMIAAACDVSPQAVSIALDPKKQKARRKYVKAWKEQRYSDDEFREHQQEMDRNMKARKRKTDPFYSQRRGG